MILVFAKAPVPGKVKTRLIPHLGEQAATGLYRELLYRTLKTACDNGQMSVQLQFLGAETHPEIQSLAEKYPISIQQQQGRDLGERMHHAAATCEAPMMVLIGTDCPALTPAYLLTAIAALEAGKDAVLGPAEDGGYVLLGLRRSHPDLFTDVDWGTDGVLEQTLSRIRQLGWQYQLLPTLWDVDRPADVQRYERLKVRSE